jgi:hypothetical protein
MENTQQIGYETQVEDVTNCINNFFLRWNFSKFQVFRVGVVQISVFWVLTLIIKNNLNEI